jgi:predicted RNase H-like nuclease
MSETLVAGVDGSRAGWVFVVVDAGSHRVEQCSVAPTFSELLLQTTSCAVVGIDVPIGLPDTMPRGGQSVDREARALLRPRRHASVFTVPPRSVLQARSYEEANEMHRAHSEGGLGMSRQVYGILPKIAEVDDLMTPRLQQRVFEVHPELSFMELNGGTPLALAKSNAGGVLTRLRLLGAVGFTDGLEDVAGDLGRTRLDDLLDAVAAAWSAVRVVCQQAVRIPSVEEVDVRGLRMEMWR